MDTGGPKLQSTYAILNVLARAELYEGPAGALVPCDIVVYCSDNIIFL